VKDLGNLDKCLHKSKKIETWVSIYGNEVAFFQKRLNVNRLPFGVFFRANNVTFF